MWQSIRESLNDSPKWIKWGLLPVVAIVNFFATIHDWWEIINIIPLSVLYAISTISIIIITGYLITKYQKEIERLEEELGISNKKADSVNIEIQKRRAEERKSDVGIVGVPDTLYMMNEISEQETERLLHKQISEATLLNMFNDFDLGKPEKYKSRTKKDVSKSVSRIQKRMNINRKDKDIAERWALNISNTMDRYGVGVKGFKEVVEFVELKQKLGEQCKYITGSVLGHAIDSCVIQMSVFNNLRILLASTKPREYRNKLPMEFKNSLDNMADAVGLRLTANLRRVNNNLERYKLGEHDDE